MFQIAVCSRKEDVPEYRKFRIQGVPENRMFQKRGSSRIEDVPEYRLFQNKGCFRRQDVPKYGMLQSSRFPRKIACSRVLAVFIILYISVSEEVYNCIYYTLYFSA